MVGSSATGLPIMFTCWKAIRATTGRFGNAASGHRRSATQTAGRAARRVLQHAAELVRANRRLRLRPKKADANTAVK